MELREKNLFTTEEIEAFREQEEAWEKLLTEAGDKPEESAQLRAEVVLASQIVGCRLLPLITRGLDAMEEDEDDSATETTEGDLINEAPEPDREDATNNTDGDDSSPEPAPAGQEA